MPRPGLAKPSTAVRGESLMGGRAGGLLREKDFGRLGCRGPMGGPRQGTFQRRAPRDEQLFQSRRPKKLRPWDERERESMRAGRAALPNPQRAARRRLSFARPRYRVLRFPVELAVCLHVVRKANSRGERTQNNFKSGN
ncbi:hypothetical protein CIHG_06499 [Coccidioides immitis H538.4]|uniref:Uncharacterized protein n=1 Tax=Coccidioides immitis H538.4 TaxID=396776 RepID=A0A0J8RVK8_COCIT|nr:hypothetical protein CIHG_06499 [Coccidioides immitis H538.4]